MEPEFVFFIVVSSLIGFLRDGLTVVGSLGGNAPLLSIFLSYHICFFFFSLSLFLTFSFSVFVLSLSLSLSLSSSSSFISTHVISSHLVLSCFFFLSLSLSLLMSLSVCFLVSLNNSSAVDRVMCLFQAHGLSEKQLVKCKSVNSRVNCAVTKNRVHQGSGSCNFQYLSQVSRDRMPRCKSNCFSFLSFRAGHRAGTQTRERRDAAPGPRKERVHLFRRCQVRHCVVGSVEESTVRNGASVRQFVLASWRWTRGVGARENSLAWPC